MCIADKMVANVDVFGSLMINRMLNNRESGLIIGEEERCAGEDM